MKAPAGPARPTYGGPVALLREETDLRTLELFERAGHNVERAAGLLRELLRVHPERSGLGAALVDCEHEGDRITHEIIRALRCSGSRSAVDIADGHALATALDDVGSGEDPAPSLHEINRLENAGDRVYRDAVASLFAAGIDPMVVIRWKDVFESLERAVDACETVAHVLEGMSLKRLH